MNHKKGSYKLNSSLEGALAGGGDPATSPLYVFGPFLKMIVVAGVAHITFGASVWLAVITIIMVSVTYRFVIKWVTDGSGGSGLSGEEFGKWAIKVDASITFIEYTLTFIVSISAMVTFLADRIPFINKSFFFTDVRTIIAILLTILIGRLVNLGPKKVARIFGIATAGLLLLLWSMVFFTLYRFGFHLPSFNFHAFSPQNLPITIGGYVRILAVMTGVEVFANLVPSYAGSPKQRSKKAFQSLIIIMGTTIITMLIVGPIIFQLSDPNVENVSVFTQTMDQLLPQPLAYFGTFIGVAVLMSASAASALGIQGLAVGLKDRFYFPQSLGEQNRHGVADKPVWIMIAIIILCFVQFGSHEETYLPIYAAGVFILLSMASWAVSKRLTREIKERVTVSKIITVIGTCIAAFLLTCATISIFIERFKEGAWMYLLFIPIFFTYFTYHNTKLMTSKRIFALIITRLTLPASLSVYEANQKNVTQKFETQLLDSFHIGCIIIIIPI